MGLRMWRQGGGGGWEGAVFVGPDGDAGIDGKPALSFFPAGASGAAANLPAADVFPHGMGSIAQGGLP